MSYDAWGEPDEIPECPHCDENKQITDELAVFVRRLVRALNKTQQNSNLANQAMDYLKRNDLEGSPLRDDA